MECYTSGYCMNDFFQDYCVDRQIDPATYLKHEQIFRDSINTAMNEFRDIQNERAERYKLLYAELELFNPQLIYEDLVKLKTKKEIVIQIEMEVAKIKKYLHDSDQSWIQHRNYSSLFFQEGPTSWIGIRDDRSTILLNFKNLFNIL
jgi:hypothetical protein